MALLKVINKTSTKINIDFILSFIKKILTIRKDLKVIITSATFNTKKFSTFFNDAPILSLEGRSYEVDIKYAKEVIKKDEKIFSNGGRVLNSTVSMKDLRTARDKALDLLDKIEWENKYYRRDICWRAIK